MKNKYDDNISKREEMISKWETFSNNLNEEIRKNPQMWKRIKLFLRIIWFTLKLIISLKGEELADKTLKKIEELFGIIKDYFK